MRNLSDMVQSSAALEGCTLTRGQCRLLLEKEISSEGKTIREQMLCLDLARAYRKCMEFAEAREFWSSYRIKTLASLALRSFKVDGKAVSDEGVLRKACDMANEQRLHMRTATAADIYMASFQIHFLISDNCPWPQGNDVMARLLMNYLQLECGLEPTVVRPSGMDGYRRILKVASDEDIAEIFVSHMLEHPHDPPEPEPVSAVPVPRVPCPDREDTLLREHAVIRKKSSRERILELLRAHPRMTTRELAEEINISAKGIEKQLGILKAAGALKRIGPDKGGHWQVVERKSKMT